MKKIAIVGSFGHDLIMQVSHIPARGETVGEGRFSEAFGGKGANQALAASRSGGNVMFVGCVGKDASGYEAVKTFTAEGMNTEFMTQTDAAGTGTAMIFVGDDGENSITVAVSFDFVPATPLVGPFLGGSSGITFQTQTTMEIEG